LPKEYEGIQLASKAVPGKKAWGWLKPSGIEFKRQGTR
jgi:hypothetical protein